MMKKVNAMIFTLMMLTVPLAGCTGGDEPVDVLGCKNTQANNYNENATKDDGTCDFDLDDDGVQDSYEVDGCTDDTANNLDLGATDDDGSCDYDLDDDGVLDADEILGCMDSTANNYNLDATDADDSCDYDLDDDGVLDADEILGCMDSNANNLDLEATDADDSCDYDLDDDGVLDADEVLGCRDLIANNYNSEATDEDGSCDYDLDDDGITDVEEIPGCMDSMANNLDLGATDDDGSCDYDLDDDGVLDADEILGCTDSAANNYNSEATDADDSCVFSEVTIAAGERHTCAILDDGSVSCWGRNNYGGLGDGTTINRNTTTQTSSLGTDRTAVAITAGAHHTCAILDDGSVSCWGYNEYGQLGDGTTTNRNTTTQTSSLGTDRTAVAITAGAHHTCAILDDGSVSCWGYNGYGQGQLGDGTTTNRNTPTQTSSLGTDRTAVAIAAGRYHTCAILDDGSVSCWGRNGDGQLGDGTNTDRLTPTQTSSLGSGRTAVAITGGAYHTCAILDDGSVSCWGNNGDGQLGDGTNTDRNTTTQTSSLGTDRTAVAIAAGSSHTCAILDDGSVSCWGANYNGRLGDGTTTNRNTPNQTSSLGTDRTAVAITAGLYHTCAILDDRSVSCWGYNGQGQLGDGTTTDRNTPTAIEIE
jgi:alpha-tubulin suppressor-like RCC1 family protein